MTPTSSTLTPQRHLLSRMPPLPFNQPNPGPTQRSIHTESAHLPPVTIYDPMVDSDGTVDSANTGTSVAAHSAADDPSNDITIDATDAPDDTSTTTVHGKKRHRKKSHKTQDSRKHHRRMAGFTATHDDAPGPDPDPRQGTLGRKLG